MDKKKRKGFTLIELLAVIVILGVVVSVILVVFVGSKDKATDKITFITEENILKSSSYYTDEYSSNLVWSNSNNNEEKACIPVKELVKKGYFKEQEIKDGGYYNKSVLVTKNNEMVNDYKFKDETNCGIVDNSVALNLNGDNPLKVKYGEEYDLWSDVSITGNNSSIDEKIITINNSNITNTKSLKVGMHEAHYSVTTYGGASATMDRNVEIIDDVAPTIEFTSPIVKSLGEDFSLMDNVNYSDNALYNDGDAIDESSKKITLDCVDINNTKSLKIGNYKIKYEVKDRSGNETIKYRDVNIINNKWDFKYVGYEEEFVAPEDGYYYIDAEGASSSAIIPYANGGEVTGYIYLNKGEKVIVNVGGSNGYNGGGKTTYDGKDYYGGGATTLRKENKYLFTAAGAGYVGHYCIFTSTSNLGDDGLFKYNPDVSNCVPYGMDKATGGSGDGTGGSNQGNGSGGNGTNGGGGSLSFGVYSETKACTAVELVTEEDKSICVIPTYKKICTDIPGVNKICYPVANGCSEYFKMTKVVCTSYFYDKTKTDDAGSGGSNSVDNSVKNYNLINGGGPIGNGRLSIKFVGDSYE